MRLKHERNKIPEVEASMTSAIRKGWSKEQVIQQGRKGLVCTPL